MVARIRRERGGKVGHAGTLDPFATGLVLVLVGQATRAQRFFMGLPKSYRAVARLGWSSDTGDRDGVLTHTGRVPATLDIPVREILQRPPAYSAVKVGGERLYERARRGDPVEGEARPVTVHRAELLWQRDERAAFELEVSSGTYVRQLVAALGDAYCEELERTAIGEFRLEDADPARELELGDALAFLPSAEVPADRVEPTLHGLATESEVEGEAVRLLHDGRLLAVARGDGATLKPFLVLGE